MSGVEILGVFATAGQVAEYGLYFIALLSTTYQKIKNAPGAVEKYTEQINKLLSITESIQQTSCQQDPIVFTHINSIHLEAKKLATILDRTSDQYSRNSDSRCLASHNRDSLRVIQNSVERIEAAMAHSTEQKLIDMEGEDGLASEYEGYQNILSRREFQVAANSSNKPEERAMVPSTGQHLERTEQSSDTDDTRRKHERRSEHETSASNLIPPLVRDIHHYVEHNELKDDAMLINGPQIIGFNNLSWRHLISQIGDQKESW